MNVLRKLAQEISEKDKVNSERRREREREREVEREVKGREGFKNKITFFENENQICINSIEE